MKLRKLILLALTVVTVAALGEVATASAEVLRLLPEPSEKSPVSFTAETKEKKALTLSAEGKTITCTNISGSTGEFTSPKAGLIIIEFKGCTSSGASCKGLAETETAGNIKFHGELALRRGRLVNAKKETVLHPGVLVVKLLHVHFSCLGGIVLGLVLGCVAGLLTPTNALTKVLTNILQESELKNGDQDIIEVEKETEKGEFENCELKTAINEGKEALSLQVSTVEATGFKQGGVAVEALLMS